MEGDGREAARRRRVRSIAIGLFLAALVVIFYLITILRFTPHPAGG
jgi:hypothetical protein